VPAGMEIATIT